MSQHLFHKWFDIFETDTGHEIYLNLPHDIHLEIRNTVENVQMFKYDKLKNLKQLLDPYVSPSELRSVFVAICQTVFSTINLCINSRNY